MSTQAAHWIGLEIGNGRYKIERVLGEGGMGSVYLGRDANLNDRVVIKTPHKYLLSNVEFTKRFALEVQSLVRLNHPHIVNIRDVGTHDGVPFAVMQYLGGGSLAELRRDQNGNPIPMGLKTIIGWLPDVAEALDFVHKQNFLHRDIKPANLLFDEHGNVYLGDFGVAKALAAAQEHDPREALTGGGFVGTAEYIAPEAVMGQRLTGAADQYSLAVTVYELLAGHRPFQGPNPSSILVKQTMEPPPPLQQARPDLPVELCEAVHRALDKDPAARFATCTAFAKAFVNAANSLTRAYCSHCGQKLKVKYSLQGTSIRCPKCKQAVTVEIVDQGGKSADRSVETLVAGGPKSDTGRVPKSEAVSAVSDGSTMVQHGKPDAAASAGMGQTLVQSPSPSGHPAAGSTMVQSAGRGGLAGVQPHSLDQAANTLFGSTSARTPVGKLNRRSKSAATKVLISAIGASMGTALVIGIGVVVFSGGDTDRPTVDATPVANASFELTASQPAGVPAPSDADSVDLDGNALPADEDAKEPKSAAEAGPIASTSSPGDLLKRFEAVENANRSAVERIEEKRQQSAPSATPTTPITREATSESPGSKGLEATGQVAEPPMSAEERERLTQEEMKRRARVQGAVLRRAPLPQLGITVEPQNLIDIARGKEKPPYMPPDKQMVRVAKSRVRTDPLSRTVHTETYYVRQETALSKARRETYRLLYNAKILPEYADEKMEVFETEARLKAETKGIFREEMLADIERIKRAYGLVRSGLNKDDITKYCELCAEFAVKFGDDSSIPDRYYELADNATGPDTPAEELEDLERELKNTELLYNVWRFKDPAKGLQYETKIEELKTKIKRHKEARKNTE